MHPAPGRIDGFDLVQNARVDAIPLPELFRSANNEFCFFVDNTADVIGDPSSRVGGVRTPFKNDNIQLRPVAFGLGGSAHSRGIAADHNQSFPGHDNPPCEN